MAHQGKKAGKNQNMQGTKKHPYQQMNREFLNE
jgi:hypothetical protein